MKSLLRITKALSDRNRVRILCALTRGELCVCQIVELLKLAHSTVSKHLSILEHADLLRSRKDGRWMYFQLNKDRPSLGTKITEIILREMKNEQALIDDEKTLKRIVCIDTTKLCSVQKKKRHAKK